MRSQCKESCSASCTCINTVVAFGGYRVLFVTRDRWARSILMFSHDLLLYFRRRVLWMCMMPGTSARFELRPTDKDDIFGSKHSKSPRSE